VWACHAHLVFVTKYRRDVFTDAMLVRCQEVMAGICDDFGCALVEFNGEVDHVHLLVNFPPSVQLSKLVNSLKRVSARLLRKDFSVHVRQYLWGGHFWSRSYYVGTAGGAPLSTIAEYIRSQERPTT
jgi:putative transposase